MTNPLIKRIVLPEVEHVLAQVADSNNWRTFKIWHEGHTYAVVQWKGDNGIDRQATEAMRLWKEKQG
jgi:hypothetical protein